MPTSSESRNNTRPIGGNNIRLERNVIEQFVNQVFSKREDGNLD